MAFPDWRRGVGQFLKFLQRGALSSPEHSCLADMYSILFLRALPHKAPEILDDRDV